MAYYFAIDGSYGNAEEMLILTDDQQAVLTDDDWERIEHASDSARARTARTVIEARLRTTHTCHEDVVGSTLTCVACLFIYGI